MPLAGDASCSTATKRAYASIYAIAAAYENNFVLVLEMVWAPDTRSVAPLGALRAASTARARSPRHAWHGHKTLVSY